MIHLNQKQIIEFQQRSYLATDGLWFMKAEEQYGFTNALGLDNEVWKVMPKIQARLLKAMAGLGDGLEALAECLTTKLTLDGSATTARKLDENNLEIVITRCPWHDLRVKSGREDISAMVGEVICGSVMSGFAAEFGKDIKVERPLRICRGAETCRFKFSEPDST